MRAAATNRFVQYRRTGGPEVLELHREPIPVPGPASVRIRVEVVALNPFDYKVRSGEGPIQPELPARIGREFAGIVDEPGDGSRWTTGERVFGVADGTLAEHVVADDADLVRSPTDLDPRIAASLPIAGQTALRAVEIIDPRPVDVVLVTAAAGGVGIIAAQLAHLRGATVIGTASEARHPALQALGIRPVRYGQGQAERIRAAAGGRPITAALDQVGDEGVRLALDLGVARDRINTVATDPKRWGVRHAERGPLDASALGRLGALVVDQSLTVPLDAAFTLDEVGAGFARLESRHVLGKVVIAVG